MSEHDDGESMPMPWFDRGTAILKWPELRPGIEDAPVMDQISMAAHAFAKLQADLRFWRRTAQAALTILVLLWFYVFFA